MTSLCILLLTFKQPLPIEVIQQFDWMGVISVIADCVAALSAGMAVFAAIWGAKRIINEFKLRAIDAVSGFYSQLRAQLIVLKEDLGADASNSILNKVYCCKAGEDSEDKVNRRARFQERIQNIITLLTTAEGQLPLSPEMLSNRDKLLKELVSCQQWLPSRFCDTDLVAGFNNFILPIGLILTEIDEKVPALLNSFWEQVENEVSKNSITDTAV